VQVDHPKNYPLFLEFLLQALPQLAKTAAESMRSHQAALQLNQEAVKRLQAIQLQGQDDLDRVRLQAVNMCFTEQP